MTRARARPARRWALFLTLAALALAAASALAMAFWWKDGRLRWASDEQLLALAEARPDDATTQAALGRRLQARGEDAAAVFAFERALARSPRDRKTRREIARLLIGQGRASEALPHLREIVKQAPGDVFAQEHLGAYYLSRGAVSWAADAFERVVAARPRNAAVWARLGQCYLSLRQPERAAEALQKAGALDPALPGYRILLGRAHLDAGRVERAEAVLRQELNGPAEAQAAYWLATLLLQSPDEPGKRHDEAVHLLIRAVEKNPAAPEPRLALGREMLRRQQPRLAAPLLLRAAVLDPEHPEPLYHLARAYQELGRAQDARRCRERFYALSRLQRERRHLELRLTQSPDDPALRRRLSELYARYGDQARAASLLPSPPRSAAAATQDVSAVGNARP